MANGGWYGTDEEWERLEKPLLEVDPIMEGLARKFGLAVSRNHKNWPERSIEWEDNVSCLIQLYLVDDKKLTFNLWLCASQDRHGKRYWKQETPVKEKTIDAFKEDLGRLLEEGRRKLLEWSNDESLLEFVGTLTKH